MTLTDHQIDRLWFLQSGLEIVGDVEYEFGRACFEAGIGEVVEWLECHDIGIIVNGTRVSLSSSSAWQAKLKEWKRPKRKGVHHAKESTDLF